MVLCDAGLSRKADSANLPLLRFEDLKRLGIVSAWTSLNKWIDERGFPPGRIIGRFRTWTTAEVMAWIESQPSTKAKRRGAALASTNGGMRSL
jgi:predicted DNA-binding transcriptional regulator AlpA